MSVAMIYEFPFCFQLAIAFDGACKDNERSPAAEALVYQDESPKTSSKEEKERREGPVEAIVLLVEIFGIILSR